MKIEIKVSFFSIILRHNSKRLAVFDFNRDFDNTLTNSFAYKILPWIKFKNYKAYRDFVKLYRKTIG